MRWKRRGRLKILHQRENREDDDEERDDDGLISRGPQLHTSRKRAIVRYSLCIKSGECVKQTTAIKSGEEVKRLG